MKIYTKKGDDGTTSVTGKDRVVKHDKYVEAVGDLDELNSNIGHLISLFHESDEFNEVAAVTVIIDVLIRIQYTIFDIGSSISRPDDEIEKYFEKEVTMLENNIDDMDRSLSPLRQFIIQGGTRSTSFVHIVRSVCRRSERSLSKLELNTQLKYINRLSDYFFTLVRFLHSLTNTDPLYYRYWKERNCITTDDEEDAEYEEEEQLETPKSKCDVM